MDTWEGSNRGQNMTEQGGNIGSTLSGFLIGAVVGAAVALLVAPGSGADTRRRLGETTKRLRDTASDKLEDMKNTFREGAKQVQQAVSEGREEYRRSTQPTGQPHESPSRPGM